jgi:branched-chain amino acid transport system substrate-binding protein
LEEGKRLKQGREVEMERIVFVIIASLLMIGLVLPGCGSSALTIFSVTEGNVYVMKARAADWIEAQVGMSLEPGDRVKTGDNSSAKITFFEGSTVELQAGTEIEITSLDISTGTGSTTIILEQTIGSIIFRVTKIIDPASRYEVETPTGTVAVRGSAVEVYVIEDGTTWATNLEGDIRAIAQGVELQIPEEGRCIIRPGQPPELTITFAVAGPMTEFQGEPQWRGAELARDEINAAGGIDIRGTAYGIRLVQVETNELLDPSGADGVTALSAVIDDVDFVIGGFRTQNVMAYREVAMDAQKIFMNCGAATDALQFSVVTDYDKYKYWFKVTPINNSFLGSALFKITGMIGTILRNTLANYGDAVAEEYRVPEDDRLRVAILMENALWCEDMLTAAQNWLPRLGFDVVGTWLVSPTATDITTELSQIAAAKPHIVFTAFSGTVGTVYSVEKTELGIPAMTIGINLAGELKSHWADTDGKCNGEIMLDSWAEGLESTAKTPVFSHAFMAETGEYPFYTALTYDAIYQLKAAIEATDSLDVDDIIPYLETHAYMGVGGMYTYYPMPDIDLGGGLYALSEAQVRALYPSLATYNQTDWLCAASGGPHIAHDLVYGPSYATGIGSQWQNDHKVGVWPMDLGDAADAALTDQYGCWNFAYLGTVDVMIPIEGFLAS